MRFLIDTCVVCELRKKTIDPHVKQWFEEHQFDEFFLSAVTIGEIRRGIELSRKKGQSQFADTLDRWLCRIKTSNAEHILPATLPVFERWGLLTSDTGNSGADNIIAATALENGLTVVTRNIDDFQRTKVAAVNPWMAA